MGVSFKISKTGKRYQHQLNPSLVEASSAGEAPDNNPKAVGTDVAKKVGIIQGVEDVAPIAGSAMSSEEHEVSFVVNLYEDGYSIGKPSEGETAHQASPQEVPKLLHPYDRASESFFSAIETGRLPGDVLDDIPCKFVSGSVMCEVRDFRNCAFEQGSNLPSTERTPVVHKICLTMSLENVIQDISMMSDNSWTYGDLMEAEARILKTLQPQLYLDPTPNLDRLYSNPVKVKLNICSNRKKRLRQMIDITMTSKNNIHGKRICMDRIPENSNCRMGDSGSIPGHLMQQQVTDNLNPQDLSASNMASLTTRSCVNDATNSQLPLAQSKFQTGMGHPKSLQDNAPGSANTIGSSNAGHAIITNYSDSAISSSSLLAKRDNQEAQMPSLSNISKQARYGVTHQQQLGSQVDSLQGSDFNWKKTLFQQAMARGQYPNMQRYPQQAVDRALNLDTGVSSFTAGQQGIHYGANEEQFATDKLNGAPLHRSRNDIILAETERNHLDPQQAHLQQRLSQQAFMNSGISHTASWNNFVQQDSRNDELLQKRNHVQSPRFSSGAVPQSPLSSKSGEFSSGSVGARYGVVPANTAHGPSQKEKAAVSSVPPAIVVSSSVNETMQRQQTQVAAKRKSNSLPKAQAISGVGSPVSVSNINVPLNASSPSVGTPPLADQSIIDRFSKIEAVTTRFQLNCRKKKIDDYNNRKPTNFLDQDLKHCLSNASNEDIKEDTCTMPLSHSLLGGSMNVPKIRVLSFMQTEHAMQGNVVQLVPKARTRLIMSEKPSDGTVAMHYGEIGDNDYLASEDYLPTLPNTRIADLHAAQFCKLMIEEGYLMEEHIQPRPSRMNVASTSQLNSPGIPTNNTAAEGQQFPEAVSGQLSGEVTKPANSGGSSFNSSQNLIASPRTVTTGNSQSLQMSQGFSTGVLMPARPQLLDSQPSLQQPSQQQLSQHSLIQQQHTQYQRSPMVLGTNMHSQLSAARQNPNMQLGSHMVNKPSVLQLQLLPQQQLQQQQQQQLQQQQQQQQPQMQRKMLGLGTAVGMGNLGNSMVGLGGLSNAMALGARGIGGAGLSSQMGPISGIGNMGQSPMNLSQTSSISNTISQQLRSLNPHAQAFMAQKLRMAHNRSSMLGAPQSNIAGMSGGRQMHPGSSGLSMWSQALNRPNLNPIQRPPLGGHMGPPKMTSGANLYMNQQQQQHQQLQMQQQHLQMQQQQQQQPQESNSPLQAVVSPPQVGSPSTMGIPQLNPQSQQQPQQASPQQMAQRTPLSPQQMSSGAIHTMSASNQEACPASPQISSQTLGSGGSITNSPMELQGVNKSNSVNNA